MKIVAKNKYMNLAIKEAQIGILNNDGGPFGSVIVKDGEIIASAHNMVLANNDSTAHGEIEAIRKAEKKLQTYSLEGCELYTTGEPCQMCLAACLWANIKHVYYGCTINDNDYIKFRDKKFDDLMGNRHKLKDYLTQIDRVACFLLFKEYLKLNPKNY